MELPSIPVPLSDFVPYLDKHSRDEVVTGSALAPFKAYEARLRQVFAQEPDNKVIKDPQVNVVPVYNGHEGQLKVKARNRAEESPAEAEKYMMSLIPELRRKNAVPAVVPSIDEFKDNFRLFSESSLVDLDWSNVVVAGSAVTTCLLPVPKVFRSSKKAQSFNGRDYYHDKIAPSSDVDLFLYGLDEEQAIEKIKQIEKCIRDSILDEVSVVRTKNALTIVSKYPTRHVQIVLRLYKSVSEILTGFDVDCACTAFDGSQVWASPRAIAAFVTQTNTIDLDRRSPSYENRLAKYAHRGFEVHWSGLDRSKVDPTIFERKFTHIVGLARLLVMEKLPTQNSRDNYIEQRRSDRDRPPPRGERFYSNRRANLKEVQPEDVAEWVEEEDVSNYHTFTIPYGPKYTAKKIEKLIYKKDLLLNAEWNKPKDRTVDLHRHPAFFGTVKDVIEDCCGYCPSPRTEEETTILEEESKKFVSGKVQFMKNDPGRQTIGSFNPITDSDWTELAYIGDTAALCQAIVDGDLARVQSCCSREGFDVDERDHTGRMPLHLAIMCGTPGIVRCLVSHGARLVSRVAGGFTALHLAAARGDVEILRAILRKSEANQVEYLEKSAKKTENADITESDPDSNESESDPDEDDDISIVGSGTTSPYAASQGSMVIVDSPQSPDEDDDKEDQPNFYDDLGVLSWDIPLSPLHVAILNGHIDIIDALATEFGVDVSQAFVEKPQYGSPTVIFSVLLAAHHPSNKSKDILKSLFELGASSTQANMEHITAFHSLVMASESRVLDVVFELDGPAAQLAINHPTVSSLYGTTPNLPLHTAIRFKNIPMIMKLLEKGANMSVFTEKMRRFWARRGKKDTKLEHHLSHPMINAAESAPPAVIKYLLDAGADPNAMTKAAYEQIDTPKKSYDTPRTVLDTIRHRIDFLKSVIPTQDDFVVLQGTELGPDEDYLGALTEGSFQHTFVKNELSVTKSALKVARDWQKSDEIVERQKGNQVKKDWVDRELRELEEIEKNLTAKGAKTFEELHPGVIKPTPDQGTTQPAKVPTAPKRAKVEINISFRDADVGDLDTKKYLPLFQAAWEGDIQKVKLLTTETKASNKSHSSLQLTAVDKVRTLDPFAIAVVRGHYDLARTILRDVENQQVQKDAKKQGRKVYQVVVDNDIESDADSEGETDTDSQGVGVRFDVVDEQQTIDDVRDTVPVGKYSTSPSILLDMRRDLSMFHATPKKGKTMQNQRSAVKKAFDSWRYYSQASLLPLGRLSFNSPVNLKDMKAYDGTDLLDFAIGRNDIEMVKFLLDEKTRLIQQKTPKEDGDESPNEIHKFVTLHAKVFHVAAHHGFIELLGYLMSKTGLEFPFQTLIKEAGVKPEVKPKYYRGLSVYGKKREDWASEDRWSYRDRMQGQIPLLLRVIRSGNIDSIKWFLSDEPQKRYREFLLANKDDSRLAPLFKSDDGYENILTSWLENKRHLALHCAVMLPRTEKLGNSLVEYILNKFPDLVNVKNSQGLTPLHAAFAGRRIMAARALVEAGADQTARDDQGRNMLHHIFITPDSSQNLSSAKLFRTLAEILDPEIIKSLATQRTDVRFATGHNRDWALRTPLSEWLSQGHDSHTDTLKEILKVTGGKELFVLDGQGNYPIHQVTRTPKHKYVQTLLEIDPNLAVLENATGVTPLEIAENKLTSHLVNAIKQNVSHISTSITFTSSYYDTYPSIYNSLRERVAFFRPAKFDANSVYGSLKDAPYASMTELDLGKLVLLLRATAAKATKKRMLVSLHDANQLVRRLEANRQKIGAIVRPAARQLDRDEVEFADEEEEGEGEGEGEQGKSTTRDEVSQWWNADLSKPSFEAKEILKGENKKEEGESEEGEEEEE
ncbi:hypothetical protein FQN52_007078 [Onygenales sp. PD_12]|nr:hypothetical protein FQN53_002980 [Emmonsiellopsis sp. PD_33]KAK2787767.1 hypothetical protein FQN52_007078 [Onygenales sp. PD_12]